VRIFIYQRIIKSMVDRYFRPCWSGEYRRFCEAGRDWRPYTDHSWSSGRCPDGDGSGDQTFNATFQGVEAVAQLLGSTLWVVRLHRSASGYTPVAAFGNLNSLPVSRLWWLWTRNPNWSVMSTITAWQLHSLSSGCGSGFLHRSLRGW